MSQKIQSSEKTQIQDNLLRKRIKKAWCKHIVKIVIIILAIHAVVIGTYIYTEKKEREKIVKMGYTEYNLSKLEMDYLVEYFDIYIPEYIEAPLTFTIDNKYNKDKDKFVLVQGEYSEQQVEKLNSLLYDERKAENAVEKASEYGFSSENRITADWIIAHPYEAVQVIRADYNVFLQLLYYNPHAIFHWNF